MEMKIPMYIAVQLESGYDKDSRRVWLPLPATKKQFAVARKAVDPHCRGIVINHYGVKVPGISRYMLAETPLAQVNHLAARLAALDDEQIIKLCAINESEMYFTTVEQLLDYTYTPEKYTLVPDILCEEDLGRRAIGELDPVSFPPEIVKGRIDPLAFGRGIADMEKGEFTSFGYLTHESRWSYTPQKRRVPAALDLKGDYGEELFGELEYNEDE